MIIGWRMLPESYGAFGDLLHSVQTGETAFDHVYGVPFYTYLHSKPRAAADLCPPPARAGRPANANEPLGRRGAIRCPAGLTNMVVGNPRRCDYIQRLRDPVALAALR